MDIVGPAEALHGDPPAAASAQGLVDRNQLALVCVERTRMPMVVTDPRQPNNPIVLANRAFLKLTGYAPDELLGRNPRFMQGPLTDRADIARLHEAIAQEREITIEMMNYRRDGSTFWNQLFVSPVHDDNGQLLYFFGSMLDISRERDVHKLEAAEHRLLKEVDHRAKNALAIVQGIVRLSRADDPVRYARIVQSRVEVLARAHGLLADSRWRDVPLARLISHEAACSGYGRIHYSGGDVDLPAAKVQPFALLLHELAINAQEHGALSCAGSVGIDWRVGEDGDLAITWQEEGGPPPPQERIAGFGLAMIQSIAERQLGRRPKLDFAPEGLRATITVALPGRQ